MHKYPFAWCHTISESYWCLSVFTDFRYKSLVPLQIWIWHFQDDQEMLNMKLAMFVVTRMSCHPWQATNRCPPSQGAWEGCGGAKLLAEWNWQRNLRLSGEMLSVFLGPWMPSIPAELFAQFPAGKSVCENWPCILERSWILPAETVTAFLSSSDDHAWAINTDLLSPVTAKEPSNAPREELSNKRSPNKSRISLPTSTKEVSLKSFMLHTASHPWSENAEPLSQEHLPVAVRTPRRASGRMSESRDFVIRPSFSISTEFYRSVFGIAHDSKFAIRIAHRKRTRSHDLEHYG